MNYNYDKSKLNKNLVNYIEENVFPQYNLNEAGHGIEHILNVINRSFDIGKNYDVDINMVYVIAAYHDIGHHIDRKNHEKVSAELMIKDENLKKYFSEGNLQTIMFAIEDHRASSGIEPRNIYGKIVSAADKTLTVPTAIKRTYSYTKEHTPELSDQEVLERIYTHLNEKFGENGYAKVYIKDEQFENFKKEIISLLKNKTEFFNKVNEVLNN